MSCSLCGDNQHNIRCCTDPIIPYLLIKVRCKKWKSEKANDFCILFNWLHKRISQELRAILIHKYRISPKTNAKGKLVAIIMELTFGTPPADIEPFWRIHLPANYDYNRAYPDLHNESERQLILANMELYIPMIDSYYEQPCHELVDILLKIMEENRRPVSAIIRKKIAYHEKCIPVENVSFECNICYESMCPTKAVRLNCHHDFCKDCTETHVEKTKSFVVTCPMCRSHITTISELTIQPL
jgi:hypothetical protein